MKIANNLEIIDLGIWLPKFKTLIFSDFHIGYEQALSSRGIMLPRYQVKDTLERVKQIFSTLKTHPKQIVINGDLKHEFGFISSEEFSGVRDLLNLLAKNCEEILIVKGNHDKITGEIKNGKAKIVSQLLIGDVLIVHGDAIIDTAAKTIIIGHAHPALKLSDGAVTEKVKCFLKGTWKGKTIIASPSFNLLVEGSDILSEKAMSPYLREAKNLEAWAVPKFNEILYFGKLKNIRSI